jgi:hypothetical protein
MTKTEIEAVLDRVRTWPPERQEDAARILLEMEAQGTEVYRLSDDERAEIEASITEADRGEFATDEEVAAIFNRARPIISIESLLTLPKKIHLQLRELLAVLNRSSNSLFIRRERARRRTGLAFGAYLS